jgi:hypothetical protein
MHPLLISMKQNDLGSVVPSETVDDIVQNAVIVVAHPDDEILWFSSILDRVKQIIICYTVQKSRPDWTTGRSQVAVHYPLVNLKFLDLNLSEIFNCANWKNPITTPYGLKLDRKESNHICYHNNYAKVKNRLQELLRPYHHIFTHNPWGEYGHEEHVQIFRVIENLQRELGFSIWVSNYASNRSTPLMLNSTAKISNRVFCECPNKERAAQIKDLYIKYGCWTWLPDFVWSDQETFLQIKTSDQHKRSQRSVIPINFLDID